MLMRQRLYWTDGRTMIERIKEQATYICLNQSEKSALAEALARQHPPLFDNSTVVAKIEGFWHRAVFEAICIYIDPLALNRDVGLVLDNTWTALLGSACSPNSL